MLHLSWIRRPESTQKNIFGSLKSVTIPPALMLVERSVGYESQDQPVRVPFNLGPGSMTLGLRLEP